MAGDIDWKKLVDDNISDQELVDKHKQLLHLGEMKVREFDSDEYNVEEIKKMCDAAGMKLIAAKVIQPTAGKKGRVDAWYVDVDSFTQREALKEAYKVKGKYEPDKYNITIDKYSQDELERRRAEIISAIARSRAGDEGERAGEPGTEVRTE